MGDAHRYLAPVDRSVSINEVVRDRPRFGDGKRVGEQTGRGKVLMEDLHISPLHGLAQQWEAASIGHFANRVGALIAGFRGAIPEWSMSESFAVTP